MDTIDATGAVDGAEPGDSPSSSDSVPPSPSTGPGVPPIDPPDPMDPPDPDPDPDPDPEAGSSGSTTTGVEGSTGAEPDDLCEPGETVSCYEGPEGTAGVGICQSGLRTCRDDGQGFGACEGAVLPEDWDNCFNEEDDDCNGVPNETCICEPEEEVPCYSGSSGTEGVGTCQAGTRRCNVWGTSWSSCLGEVTPAIDDCNTAADEDCDGANDPCPAPPGPQPPACVPDPGAFCSECGFAPAQVNCAVACSNYVAVSAQDCGVQSIGYDFCVEWCSGENAVFLATTPAVNATFGCLTLHGTCDAYMECYDAHC